MRTKPTNSDKKSKTKPNSIDSSKELISIAQSSVEEILHLFDTSFEGLSEEDAKKRLEKSGLNEIAREKAIAWYMQLLKTVTNPPSLLLITLGVVSLLTGSAIAALIIFIMVVFGGLLRFSQEFKSNKAAEKLRAMVSVKATVSRKDDNNSKGVEIEVKSLVPGDIILLSAGDIIPADVRLIQAKDLFLTQSTLTGESLPAEKHVDLLDHKEKNPLEFINLCFMGTAVVSGSGTAVVAKTGSHTYLASLAKTISGQKVRTSLTKP